MQAKEDPILINSRKHPINLLASYISNWNTQPKPYHVISPKESSSMLLSPEEKVIAQDEGYIVENDADGELT
jgi:hypothetical protein